MVNTKLLMVIAGAALCVFSSSLNPDRANSQLNDDKETYSDSTSSEQGLQDFLVIPSGTPDRPVYDVLGGRFTLLATGKETGGQFSLIEVLSPLGAGVPLHINADVDETFFIKEGELTFQLEDKIVIASAGSLVYLPRCRAFSYVNSGMTTAKFLSFITPGGKLENFFPEAGQLVTEPSAPIAPPSQDIVRINAIALKYKIQLLSPSNASTPGDTAGYCQSEQTVRN
ncbi:cupin domain-containing protein [Chroococcidiopsis sp.]|uniref:cupin domain-containing protein n=1 Tax=Chroococcidiopsis sp. TaxID=3088168 RepID=UPI003F3081B9